MKRNTHTGAQHFLNSPALVATLVGKSSIKSTDTVYDIGAGSGVITSVLARKAARVIAIEIDSKTIDILRRNLGNTPNVDIIEGDFLTLPLPKAPYKIFANIPFSISAEILGRLFNTKNAPDAAYFIVQQQFGKKMVSSEKGSFTSQLGMLLGAEYSIKIIHRLNRTDFSPPPAVDTVLIELIRRKAPLVPVDNLVKYRQFTETCFSNQKFMAKQPLNAIGATPGLSPSRLTLSQWIILFNAAQDLRRK